MKTTHLKKLGALALMMAGAATQVHASELFPNLPAKNIGVQVKIQNFTAADAAQIKSAGFGFVRFGVWSDSLTAKAYQKQVSDAFAAAQSAGLPVLLTVRAIKALPADTLTLPSHGKPFTGLHERVQQLKDHHAERLAEFRADFVAPAGEVAPRRLDKAVERLEMLYGRTSPAQRDWLRQRLQRSAFDPEAMQETQRLYPDQSRLILMGTPESVLKDADALIICTEWQQFKAPDFDLIQQRLKAPVIFDGRNLYDADRLARNGFKYFPIGRGDSRKLPMPLQQWSDKAAVA